jgi:hypothetical protein
MLITADFFFSFLSLWFFIRIRILLVLIIFGMNKIYSCLVVDGG